MQRLAHLPVQREWYGRREWNLYESALPKRRTGSGPIRFEFEGGIGFLQSPALEDALHRRDIPIPDVPGLSDGWAERDADKQHLPFLYRVPEADPFDFCVWRAAVLEHRSSRAPDDDRVVSGGRREHELAREAHQLRRQLLANHQ